MTLAPLSLTMFGVALLAGRRAGNRRPSVIVMAGFVLLAASMVLLIPLVPRADNGWHLVIPLMLAGAGSDCSPPSSTTMRCRRSRRSASASGGVTSATGSFGLSFGLAFAGAIMLAALSLAFTNKAEGRCPPPADQEHIAEVLEDDAQVMSDAQLEELLAGQPEEIQDEILSINDDARDWPCRSRSSSR